MKDGSINLDSAQQDYLAKRMTGPGEVMMSPIDPETGKPWTGLKKSRLFRGAEKALSIQMQSPWSKGGKRGEDFDQSWLAEKAAKGLRLMGNKTQAEWLDRLTVTRKVEGKREEKQQAKAQKLVDSQAGTLNRIEGKVNAIYGMMQAQTKGIQNIRTMLAPREVTVGKGDSKSSVTFNPLAPSGSEFTGLGKKDITDEIAAKAAKAVTILQAKEEERRGKEARLLLKKQAATGGAYLDPKEGASPMAVLSAKVAELTKKVDEGLSGDEPPDPDGWLGKVLSFFATAGKYVVPFLGKMLLFFGKMSGVGLAAWLGVELGHWLNEKFKISERIVDVIFGIREWWEGLDIRGMFTDMKDSLVQTWVDFKDDMLDKFYGIKDYFEQMLVDTKAWIYNIIPGHSDEETAEYKAKLQAELDAKKAAREQARQNARTEKQREKYTAKLGASVSLSDLQQQKVDLEAAIEKTDDPKFKAFLLEQRRQTLSAMEKKAPGSTKGATTSRYTGGQASTPIERKNLQMPDKTLQDVILSAAKKVGVDPGLMLAMARQESSFNPSAEASTSSAKGLYQFINSTWGEMLQKYGGQYPELEAGPMDAQASATAGALFIKENAEVLKKAGIALNASNLYTAHFLGAGGARKLLSAPADAIAADLLPAAAKANQGIFFDKSGRARTVSEVEGLMYQKIGRYADAYTAALGLDADKSTVTAGQPHRLDGGAVDSDSRAVAQGQRGGGEVIIQPAVVNNNRTVEKAPQVATARRTSPHADDTGVVNAAARDSSLPAMA